MSRPAKRSRYERPDRDDEDRQTDDLFGARELASSLKSSSKQTDPVLMPVAYEVTLNHDGELRDSFRFHEDLLRPDSSARKTTRLVPWKSNGAHDESSRRIWADRYDAIHLLDLVPKRVEKDACGANSLPRPDEPGEAGWSDLDSDVEDTFYLTEDEISHLKHTKHQLRLESEQKARLEALEEARACLTADDDAEASAMRGRGQCPVHENDLTRAQFELMQRTAAIVTTSANGAALELKILANHGSDPRFAFLRPGSTRLTHLWHRLCQQDGSALTYQDARLLAQSAPPSSSGVAAPPGMASNSPATATGLLSGYDSDSDSDSEPVSNTPKTAALQQSTPSDPSEEEKKRQRLARARAWLASRKGTSTQPQ
ncbi:hypothetical protein BCV70DRAFT_199172 [Testicularia cyperi]|uniref:SURP motif domain-containing protein n=1 Tax=Testicularia cyperi TaxID=1882483 RepID=A0A317XWR1_9BASI|nr:hypothetical protein BCV70DRAFT_199172 [Testicularia cyperi]